MTIFDSIKYPIVNWEQASEIYPTLPKGVKAAYQKWCTEKNGSKSTLIHMSMLRKFILEYEE